MEFLNIIGCFLGGVGLGFGISGNTDIKKIIGWVMCALGFLILHFTGFKF